MDKKLKIAIVVSIAWVLCAYLLWDDLGHTDDVSILIKYNIPVAIGWSIWWIRK